MQSVPKTTKVMCSNPAHGEVYSIQHNVIKFFSVRWFSPATSVSSTNKTDCQDKADIVLKVAINTITITITRILILINRVQIYLPLTSSSVSMLWYYFLFRFILRCMSTICFTHRVKSTLRSRVKWQSKTMTLKDALHWYFKKQNYNNLNGTH
jgi:hypothetical protein